MNKTGQVCILGESGTQSSRSNWTTANDGSAGPVAVTATIFAATPKLAPGAGTLLVPHRSIPDLKILLIDFKHDFARSV